MPSAEHPEHVGKGYWASGGAGAHVGLEPLEGRPRLLSDFLLSAHGAGAAGRRIARPRLRSVVVRQCAYVQRHAYSIRTGSSLFASSSAAQGACAGLRDFIQNGTRQA